MDSINKTTTGPGHHAAESVYALQYRGTIQLSGLFAKSIVVFEHGVAGDTADVVGSMVSICVQCLPNGDQNIATQFASKSARSTETASAGYSCWFIVSGVWWLGKPFFRISDDIIGTLF